MAVVRIAGTKLSYSLALIWLLTALSSFVAFEPAPYDVLSIALFVGFFATGLKIPVGIKLPLLLLGIFLAANILATVFVSYPQESLRSLSVRVFLVANWLFLVSVIRRDPAGISGALWNGYIVAAAFACVAGIAGYMDWFGSADQILLNSRVRAFFKDPNVFGPFLVPVMLQVLVKLEDRRTASASLSLGICALLLVGILLSFSRGAWLNTAISLTAYFVIRLLSERNRRDRARLVRATAVLTLAGVAGLGLAMSTDQVQEMLAKRTQVQSYDVDSQGGRFATQLAALQSAARSPIGIGPGQSDLDRYFGMSTHNMFLHVLVEAGWLGGAAFYAFLLLTLARAWHFLKRVTPVQKEYVACYAALLGILSQSAFIDATHWRHMYLLFGCLWGLMLAYPERRDATAAPGPY